MTIREFFETITVEEIGSAVLGAALVYVGLSVLILAVFYYFFMRD